jgi:hypothetical protein
MLEGGFFLKFMKKRYGAYPGVFLGFLTNGTFYSDENGIAHNAMYAKCV